MKALSKSRVTFRNGRYSQEHWTEAVPVFVRDAATILLFVPGVAVVILGKSVYLGSEVCIRCSTSVEKFYYRKEDSIINGERVGTPQDFASKKLQYRMEHGPEAKAALEEERALKKKVLKQEKLKALYIAQQSELAEIKKIKEAKLANKENNKKINQDNIRRAMQGDNTLPDYSSRL